MSNPARTHKRNESGGTLCGSRATWYVRPAVAGEWAEVTCKQCLKMRNARSPRRRPA